MTLSNYGQYICKTASCPALGDWAIANKLTVKWGSAKRGDLVMFDFNHNGTSDHIGIVTKVTSTYIETIEGNTGSGSNTNGDGVYRRKRYKKDVNYFVRTKCPNIEAVIKTAESQLGYKEGRNNNNKYGKWFGYNNVAWCCEFVVWCFYHTTAKATASEAKKVSYKHCIDTSYWQGKHSVSDWKKVRKSCTYAIHRASYTSQDSFSLHDDSTFLTNFKNSQEAGLICGAYHYSQAKTATEAKKEAEYLCKRLKGLSVPFYVVCDYEFGGRLNSKTASKANEVVNAFCDVVKEKGYNPCIYANTSTLNKYVTKPKYPVWVAQYNSTCTYKGSKVMWQYTSSGKVSGISGRVDLSLVYSAPSIEPKPSGRTYTGEFPNLVAHSCDKIAVTADNLSYALKTSKSTYTYPNGKPKDSFKTAINKVYPKRSSWSKQCQAGASCDVGAGTVIRYSGVDTKMPRGLQEQIPHLKKHWTLVGHEKSDMKRGYVGVYSGNGGHIWIGLGNGIIAEANHTAKYFEHKVQKTIGKGNHTYFAIFKPRTSSPIGKGDKGTQVKKLQLFLKWYGADCGTVDGECGDKTVGAIKKFQYHEGLTVDGVCGKKTLEKMKGIKR